MTESQGFQRAGIRIFCWQDVPPLKISLPLGPPSQIFAASVVNSLCRVRGFPTG